MATYSVNFCNAGSIAPVIVRAANRQAAINLARSNRPDLAEWEIADLSIIGWE
jgi:hypothetical protein